MLVLQIEELGLRSVKTLLQGHTACKQMRGHSTPELPDCSLACRGLMPTSLHVAYCLGCSLFWLWLPPTHGHREFLLPGLLG